MCPTRPKYINLLHRRMDIFRTENFLFIYSTLCVWKRVASMHVERVEKPLIQHFPRGRALNNL